MSHCSPKGLFLIPNFEVHVCELGKSADTIRLSASSAILPNAVERSSRRCDSAIIILPTSKCSNTTPCVTLVGVLLYAKPALDI